MPVIQNTFDEDYGKGYAGMEASGELGSIITRDLESATCGFGQAVYAGAGDKGAVTTPSARLLGFTIANRGLPVTATRLADTFIANDNLRVKNRGAIYVNVAVAVADGDPVYVTPAGLNTNVTAGNTQAIGWEFDETLTAAGVARIVRR